jgi:predicted ArsR family transcriptional regulator
MALFFNRKSKAIPANATFRLTQEGRKKVQEFTGDPKSVILTALETSGTSDIDEIANNSGLSRGKVERYIPVLVTGQYIQYVTRSDDDED